MKTRRFNLLAAMLLLGMMCLSFSSCSKDDDGDDDPSGGDSGWVDDDEDDDGVGIPVSEDAIVGLWVSQSRGDDTKESIRFTNDGIVTYDCLETAGNKPLNVTAVGTYEYRNGRITATYDKVEVSMLDGSDTYGIFTDGRQAVEIYEPVFDGQASDREMMLIADSGTDMRLEKYDDADSFPQLLSGMWNVVMPSGGGFCCITFTPGKRVTYEYSNSSNGYAQEILAKGSYTILEDMRIVVEYDDVSVSSGDDGNTVNGFVDGDTERREYSVLGFYNMENKDDILLYETDGDFMHLTYKGEADDTEDETDDTGNTTPVVGIWVAENVFSLEGRADVGIQFESNNTGTLLAVFEDGSERECPFKYVFNENDHGYDMTLKFMWTSTNEFLFDNNMIYEVILTQTEMRINGITFSRME